MTSDTQVGTSDWLFHSFIISVLVPFNFFSLLCLNLSYLLSLLQHFSFLFVLLKALNLADFFILLVAHFSLRQKSLTCFCITCLTTIHPSLVSSSLRSVLVSSAFLSPLPFHVLLTLILSHFPSLCVSSCLVSSLISSCHHSSPIASPLVPHFISYVVSSLFSCLLPFYLVFSLVSFLVIVYVSSS